MGRARARVYGSLSQRRPLLGREGRVVVVSRLRLVASSSSIRGVNNCCSASEKQLFSEAARFGFSQRAPPRGYTGIPRRMSLGREFPVSRRGILATWSAKEPASDTGRKDARTETEPVFGATLKGWDIGGTLRNGCGQWADSFSFSQRLRNRYAPSITDRMEAGALRASLVLRASVYGGDPGTRGRKQKNRTTAYKYATYNFSWTFVVGFTTVPGCDKNRRVFPSVQPPRRVFRNNAVWRLVEGSRWVIQVRPAPFVTGARGFERNSPPTPSEQPRRKRERNAGTQGASGRYTGCGLGKGCLRKIANGILRFFSKT